MRRGALPPTNEGSSGPVSNNRFILFFFIDPDNVPDNQSLVLE